MISDEVPHHRPLQQILLALRPGATPAGFNFHFPVNTRCGSLIVSRVDRVCCASKLRIAASNIAPLQGDIVVGPLEVGTTKTEEMSDEERSLKEKFVGGCA
jgi:hypothetical protein